MVTALHRSLTLALILLIVTLPGCNGGAGGAGGASGGGRDAQNWFAHGVVAADHPAASEAGAQMLRRGGNAVDAAVATSFALSVVRPYSCGIGGGGFMVIHRAGGKPPIALDYRETAPAAVDPDFYRNRGERASTVGGAAVATPGTVAGLLHALESWGTMDRREVLAPAIGLAREGFLVDEHYLASVQPLIERFGDPETGPELRQRFGFVWSRFLREGRVAIGDRIRLPEQAEALELIAEQGAAAFYQAGEGGPIAEAIIEAVQRDGGVMVEADLESYLLRRRAPLRFEYRGHTFLTMPPPSSGGIAMAQALGILEILEGDDGTGGPGRDGGGGGGAHRLVEAFKHAFADRAVWLADPDFVPVPQEQLLSRGYLRARAATFDPSRTLGPEAYGTRETAELSAGLKDAGTSHLSVVDRWGNAVACTETINLTFGSLVAVERFGFILNNEMDDFTADDEVNSFGLRQSERNLPGPRKRPLSSMTPTIVLGPPAGRGEGPGQVKVVAGGAGGPRIITATAQCILNALEGMDAPEAVAVPRLHHQWMPDVVLVEEGMPAQVKDDLASRGHQVRESGSLANVQIIVRARQRSMFGGWRSGWSAASDPRKGGQPAGH